MCSGCIMDETRKEKPLVNCLALFSNLLETSTKAWRSSILLICPADREMLEMLPCTCSLSSSISICKFISLRILVSVLKTKFAKTRELRRFLSQLIKTSLTQNTLWSAEFYPSLPPEPLPIMISAIPFSFSPPKYISIPSWTILLHQD